MMFSGIEKIKYVSIGLLRAFPIFITITSIIYGILFNFKIGIFFGLFCILCDIFSHFLKIVFKNIYGNKEILPILGLGRRPNGAKYCGLFINENNLNGKSTSFGMPSGHSQIAMITLIFWSLYLLNNFGYNNRNYISILILVFICFSVLVSRYVLGCHTVQQIIFGSINGIILGYLGYLLYNKFFK